MLTKKMKSARPLYGQLVIGPPGSGKTSYCKKMCEFLKSIGRNQACVVNLDPANENFDSDIDVKHVITVEEVMADLSLGPNGALMYCVEYLNKNLKWLLERLGDSPSNYFIFDCPGQVELYTTHNFMASIFNQLQTSGYHLCAVNLIESHFCSEPSKFISATLLSLHSMLQLGIPHVNLLSKADQLKEYKDKLLFNVDFYTDVLDLKYLLDAMESSDSPVPIVQKKYSKLTAAIVSMVEDYSLVSFQLLNINDNNSLLRVKNLIDKANGYIYGAGEEIAVNTLLACAIGAENECHRLEHDINPYTQ